MKHKGRGVVGWCIIAALAVGGCATVQTIPHHAQQERVERLLATVLPYSEHPNTHYWVRIIRPDPRTAHFLVLSQEHLYFTETLVSAADDAILTALLAHGVAHHEIHHLAKRDSVRGAATTLAMVASCIVPGTSAVGLVADPMIEGAMSTPQEFTADIRAIIYLEHMGYTVDDYVRALEFLSTHHYAERTGGVVTTEQRFSSRIAAIRRRHVSPTAAHTPKSTDAGLTPQTTPPSR